MCAKMIGGATTST